MSRIAIEGLCKHFPGDVRAVDGVDLTIEDGEFTVLVGPSGSGKSTVLRMVGGLEMPTHGTIRIGDRVVNQLPPKARDIAMVFQDYALYPQMSVFQNMEFALKMRRQPKSERRLHVNKTAAMLGIDDLLDRLPAQLSGGQRQRVAMGRAIVREPQAFLMDEPLSNLDAKLRVQMRAEIMRLHQRLGTTTMFVTHDQTEAMTMGQRIVVMRDGQTEQVDVPKRIYDEPANLFVGTFIGSPPMNVVRARLVGERDTCHVTFGIHRLAVPEGCFARCRDLRSFVGRDVLLGIRPESIEEAQFTPHRDANAQLDVEVSLVEQMGAEVVTHFKIDAPHETLTAMTQFLGSEQSEAADLDSSTLLTARLDPRTRVTAGDRVTLAVEVANLYFFDPGDKSAIR